MMTGPLVVPRPGSEAEMTAMQVVMDYERAQGRQVKDVHEENLGYDVKGTGRRNRNHSAFAQRTAGGPIPVRLVLALLDNQLRQCPEVAVTYL